MISRNILAMAVLISGSLTSCLKKENVQPTLPSQLFRPIGFTGSVNVVDVSFNWTPIKNASYLLEISRDSFLFERDLQTIAIDRQTSFEIEDLWSQSRYSARIKAVSKDPAVKDSDYQMITFRTALENVFYQVAPADIASTTIGLKWEAGKSVTHIEILSGGTAIRNIALGEIQINEGNVIVENLQPATAYTFRIYNGEVLRGTISALTIMEASGKE